MLDRTTDQSGPTRPNRLRARLRLGAATVLAAALAVAATAAPATAAPKHTQGLGERSLAQVLAADGNGFDHNKFDFDILDGAIHAVLAAKPDSPVGVLADGTTPVTAFLPTDRAFELLSEQVTGVPFTSEEATLTTLATTLGIDTIEQVLLYHVIPGQTLGLGKVLSSSGAAVPTALGPTVTIKVRYLVLVSVVDKDPTARNPYVILPNVNSGNKQIGHAIDRVLRPVDL